MIILKVEISVMGFRSLNSVSLIDEKVCLMSSSS